MNILISPNQLQNLVAEIYDKLIFLLLLLIERFFLSIRVVVCGLETDGTYVENLDFVRLSVHREYSEFASLVSYFETNKNNLRVFLDLSRVFALLK